MLVSVLVVLLFHQTLLLTVDGNLSGGYILQLPSQGYTFRPTTLYIHKHHYREGEADKNSQEPKCLRLD